MVDESQSGMTEERINAVIARASESPEPQPPEAQPHEPHSHTPEAHTTDAQANAPDDREEAQAVTETPAQFPAAEETAAEPIHATADQPDPQPDPANANSTVDPLEVGIASGVQYRQDTRYEVEGDAEVFVKTGSMGTTLLRGHILDLSSSGCFIQTMARVMIKPGTVVQLIFSVYGSTFRIDATSRFARMRVGVGFRFLEMDAATHKRLHAVLGDIRSRLIHEKQPLIDRTILE
jgi:hypothetical protein